MVLFCVLLVTLASFLTFLYVTSSNYNIRKNAASLVTANNREMELNIDNYLDKVQEASDLLFSDPMYYTYDPTKENTTRYDQLQARSALETRIMNLGILDNYTDFFVLYSNNDRVGWSCQTTVDMFSDLDMYAECAKVLDNAQDSSVVAQLSADAIVRMVKTNLPNYYHIPSSEIQVLTPTRKGELGTVNLNKELQTVLNPAAPGKKEKAFGDVFFREGDRVMQIKNNYDMLLVDDKGQGAGSGVFNGDIGRIVSVDPEGETLSVRYDGGTATYGFDSLPELEHAWAMTVHKAQGSEYRAVILVLNPASQMLMTRSILYTAVTRARELLIMVGDDQTAYAMIDQYRQTRRYNALRVRLRKLCGIEA